MSEQQPEPTSGETGTVGAGPAAPDMSVPGEPVAATAGPDVESQRLAPDQEETSPKADAPKVEAPKAEAPRSSLPRSSPQGRAPQDGSSQDGISQGRCLKPEAVALPRQGDDHVVRASALARMPSLRPHSSRRTVRQAPGVGDGGGGCAGDGGGCARRRAGDGWCREVDGRRFRLGIGKGQRAGSLGGADRCRYPRAEGQRRAYRQDRRNASSTRPATASTRSRRRRPIRPRNSPNSAIAVEKLSEATDKLRAAPVVRRVGSSCGEGRDRLGAAAGNGRCRACPCGSAPKPEVAADADGRRLGAA